MIPIALSSLAIFCAGAALYGPISWYGVAVLFGGAAAYSAWGRP